MAGYGDLILVAGGIYGRGGKVMAGGLTNRVALNKALTLMSVSRPSATVIQGAWDSSSTNGPRRSRGLDGRWRGVDRFYSSWRGNAGD